MIRVLLFQCCNLLGTPCKFVVSHEWDKSLFASSRDTQLLFSCFPASIIHSFVRREGCKSERVSFSWELNLFWASKLLYFNRIFLQFLLIGFEYIMMISVFPSRGKLFLFFLFLHSRGSCYKLYASVSSSSGTNISFSSLGGNFFSWKSENFSPKRLSFFSWTVNERARLSYWYSEKFEREYERGGLNLCLQVLWSLFSFSIPSPLNAWMTIPVWVGDVMSSLYFSGLSFLGNLLLTHKTRWVTRE